MNDFGERKNSLLLSNILKSDDEILNETIEISYKKPSENWTNKRYFHYYQINQALDYYNSRKIEGYKVSMKKVESE
jgi:hypothetical protein